MAGSRHVRARFVVAMLVATMCVYPSPAASQQKTSLQQQIDEHEGKLADARAANASHTVAYELTEIGILLSNSGQKQAALRNYNEALPIFRAQGDRVNEASTLANMAKVYSDLGEKQRALSMYDEVLSIDKEFPDRPGHGTTLNNIGKVYGDLGQHEKEMEFYQQALAIHRKTGNLQSGGLTLSNMGGNRRTLGAIEEALDYYRQALDLERLTGDRFNEGLTLNNIGVTYGTLGQPKKALTYYNEALTIRRTLGDRGGEADTLTNIGQIYGHNGDLQSALDYFEQALVIRREVGNPKGEEWTLVNLGIAYNNLGEQQKALDYYHQAQPIQLAIGDRNEEASTLWLIGLAYRDLKQDQNVLANEVAALSLAQEVGDLELQGRIQTALMRYFRDQNRPETAVFFGMQSVNSYQQMRRGISGLNNKLQARFVHTKSSTYRQLAELLVQTNRLGEAEHVLDLLKEQELKEVVRGAPDNPAAKVDPLSLTEAQQKAQGELAAPEKAAIALTAISMQYATLQAKTSRTSDEEAQLKQLDARIEAGNGEVSAFFKNTLYPELAQKAGTQDANALLSKEKSEVSQLQNTLAELGPRVLGIRLLLGEDHAYAIVITSHTRQKFELKATPAQLRGKVLEVRNDLRSPTSNPKPHLNELYSMVVAPLDSELKALESQSAGSQARALPTLLWSLDGVMRYVPIAALYDGTHYMVERFNNVLFTPESYGHMTAPASGTGLRVLAMGLSKSYGGLPALPGVMPELEAIVHDPAVPGSHGPMDGRLLPNDQFTLAALKSELAAGGSFPVVHIASHFVAETSGGNEPYLMLGGDSVGADTGYELTLSKLENSAISFHGTHLLTLSACSTAKGDAASDGLEMDSLGMVAQQKDAEAVLATLWDVSDASTSRLMSDFYARWMNSPAQGKAEALRQAQLALLHGTAPIPQGAQPGRGLQIDDSPTPAQKDKPTSPPHAASFDHPYYWAPFILIGNFQ